jgi:hypothetical protein
MKKIILSTLIITTSLASLPMANAQNLMQKAKAGIESATGAVKQAVGEEKSSGAGSAAIREALDQIKLNIADSTKKLEITSKPNEEKMKEMDSIIADIDGVLAMSGEGGEYEKLIQKSVTANKEKLSQMKAYANNPSIPAAQRAVIERKIPQFESTLTTLGENRVALVRISNDLKKQRDQVAKSKELYMFLVSLGDLEEANNSVSAVNQSMTVLMKKLEELSELTPDLESKAGPALQ